MKCIAKPVEYECIQWTGDNIDEVKRFCENKAFVCDNSRNWLNVLYEYSYKWQTCYVNDWILRTNSGYYRVIHKDDFCRIYSI